jgi:hypothetical protein
MTAGVANHPILAEHAAAIRSLSKRIITDVIEIGARLAECRRILKDEGRWRTWLEGLRVSPQTAGRFIQLHELSGDVPNLEHLDLPVSTLYLLATPSTPEAALVEVTERAEAGEVLPTAEVKQVIEKHKLPAKKKPKPTAVEAVEALDPAAESAIDQLREENHSLRRENDALRSEVEELRRQLEVFRSPVRCKFVEDDGGRAAAGYGEAGGDCVARAIAIAAAKPYAEVFEALKAKHASYVKCLRHDHYERRTRAEPVANGCSEKVYGPYLRSLGWKYTRITERCYLRAGALPSGRLIVNLDHHFVALIDGVIHDTYDSGGAGKRPVDGYWSFDPAPAVTAKEVEPVVQLVQEAPPTDPDAYLDDIPDFLLRQGATR